MANLNVLDGAAASKYLKTSGAGDNGDPHIPEHLETNSAAILTALQTIDDMISGSEAQVDVVSSALPTGAATAANQTTIIGHVDGVETLLTTIAGAVSGTEVQVDVLTLPALPAGTNGIGKLTANSGVDIGDVDVTSIAAGSNTIGGTTDAGPSWTSVYGVSGARFTSSDASSAAASVTDAPTAGQKLVITDIIVSVDTAMRVDFKLETAGTVYFSIYLPANGSGQITPRSELKLGTADKKLQVQTSAAGNIAVTAFYYSEA